MGFIYKGKSAEDTRGRILQALARHRNERPTIGNGSEVGSDREARIHAAGMIGRSEETARLVDSISTYRNLNMSCLITGERGTGKELVAKALVPKRRRLIAINAGRFEGAEHLLESELFGSVRLH